VNTTGQAVRRGEALLEVYSPDLVLAQREYLVARSAAADMAQADILARFRRFGRQNASSRCARRGSKC
jgi:Cu(I)/Ag(I) efflux system membrane fusion protein